MRFRRFNRFASRAEAAIVTARQSRWVDPASYPLIPIVEPSIVRKSWDCFGPCNSFTALIETPRTRAPPSAVCCLQMNWKTIFFVFMEPRLV